ncbi:hypothetical protein KBD33_01970 [Candidatus Gracilibacteria bacterium]|nr:hypothetical protein [Candidatus Gracilibacteria bacterium]
MYTIKTLSHTSIYCSSDTISHGNHSNWPFDSVVQKDVPSDAVPPKSLLLGMFMNHAISDVLESGHNTQGGSNIDEGLLMSALIKVRMRQKEFWKIHG